MSRRFEDGEFPRYGDSENPNTGQEINRIPPEFNEVRPDINFFNEMPIADREHISGNGNPEEGDEPPKKEKRVRDQQGAMRSLLKAVGKGAASFVATAALVSVTAQAVAPDGLIAQRIKAFMRDTAQRQAATVQTAAGPEGYAALWNDEEGAPHDYDYEHPEILKEATCMEDGSYRLNCRQCDHVGIVTIPAGGHVPGEPVEENRTEPTCDTDGSYEQIVFCAVCGEELSRETVVLAAAGHQAGETVIENESDAVCTEGGSYDEVVYCEVCGEELSRNTVTVEAMGHTAGEPVEEDRVEPACVTEGHYDEVVYCEVCGEELSRETVSIAATGHTPGSPVEENRHEPTCLEDGSYEQVVYCSVCGETIERTVVSIPAAGTHTAGTAVEENRREPSCVTDGGFDTVVYCSVCGEEVSRESNVLAATGHTAGEAVIENVHDATCTAQGYSDTVVRCTVCNEVISSERSYTAALGHTYSDLHYGDFDGEDHSLKCSRCGTYALTCSFVNSNTVQYSIDPDFIAQAAAMGAGMMEFDVLVYTNPDRTFDSWIGGCGDEITAASGTFTCDFEERDETLYYEITLRFAEDGGADDIIYVWPSTGQYMTYTP